jgi:hypothetical protein
MDGRDPVAQALDGATGDYAISGDAMRWSPDLAGESEASLARVGSVDLGAGIGTVLGLDTAGVRRLVSSALFSLTSAASDVVTELRQLTHGPGDDDEER